MILAARRGAAGNCAVSCTCTQADSRKNMHLSLIAHASQYSLAQLQVTKQQPAAIDSSMSKSHVASLQVQDNLTSDKLREPEKAIRDGRSFVAPQALYCPIASCQFLLHPVASRTHQALLRASSSTQMQQYAVRQQLPAYAWNVISRAHPLRIGGRRI